MLPFKEVYGLAAPFRLISGMVAMSCSYKATLSPGIVLFFAEPMVTPDLRSHPIETTLPLDGHSHCVPSAQAKSSDTPVDIAADHFINQCNQHSRPARADRMSNS